MWIVYGSVVLIDGSTWYIVVSWCNQYTSPVGGWCSLMAYKCWYARCPVAKRLVMRVMMPCRERKCHNYGYAHLNRHIRQKWYEPRFTAFKQKYVHQGHINYGRRGTLWFWHLPFNHTLWTTPKEHHICNEMRLAKKNLVMKKPTLMPTAK
jgi:hypothetical protein